MSRYMYDPQKDKRNGIKYDLPIFAADNLLSGFTYKEVIDEVVANYGHNATEKQIRKHVKERLALEKERMEENLMLCIDNMLAEIKEDK